MACNAGFGRLILTLDRIKKGNNVMDWTKRWTITQPTEPGYYWAIENIDNIIIKTHIIEYLGPDSIFIMGTEREPDINEFTHFMGPLEMPNFNKDERYFPIPTKEQVKYWNSEKYKREISTQNLRP